MQTKSLDHVTCLYPKQLYQNISLRLFISLVMLFLGFFDSQRSKYRSATNSNAPAFRSQDTICVFNPSKGSWISVGFFFRFFDDLDREYQMHIIANLGVQLEKN